MYRYPKFGQRGVVENDLNIYFRDTSKTVTWDKQTEFGCRASFTCTSDVRQYLSNLSQHIKIEANEQIDIVFNLAPGAMSSTIYHGSKHIANSGTLTKMPHVIGLPTGHPVNDIVNMASPNHVEHRLLQLAFGAEFNAERLKNYSQPHYIRIIAQARERLKNAVSEILPSSLNMTIDLLQAGTTQQEVAIQPIDLEFGYAPLGSRGTGVKTLLTLLCGLLEANVITEQLVIYIDEPETSLHADSQHRLRALLEELGRRPSVQILYATHSSSMINNMRPHSVRLLKRVLKNEKVVTQIIDRPVDLSFALIRSSLGMSPADSLLYAPISIIVEGVTDSICIPILLRRLSDLKVDGFNGLDRIVSQCHILDGEGDSYLYQIKLAKSQGSKPIVFLDGDKNVSSEEQNEHSDVTFIRIEDKKEIEELIPTALYIEALRILLEQDGQSIPENLTADKFKEWELNFDDKAKTKAFTKRFDHWLYEINQNNWDIKKPRVMKKAIELVVSTDQINHVKLLELVNGIASLLPSSH